MAHGLRSMKRLHRIQRPSGFSTRGFGFIPGSRQESIRLPTLLSIAGSRVSAALIVSSTASEEATAGP